MKPAVVLMIDDARLAARLVRQVQQAGYTPHLATNEATIAKTMVLAPVLCLIDLAAQRFNWEKLVRVIKGPMKKNNHVPVLGFAPQLEAALEDQAKKAGCTVVVTQANLEDNLANLIDDTIWRVDEAICAKPLPSLVRQGIAEFNQGLYFACHETLEDAWNEEEGLVRLLYQGILQIAVGYLHITRQNWRGAVKVLERGIPKAAHFRPKCQGIDVADLVAQAQAVHAHLLILGPEQINAFDKAKLPKVRVEYNL